MRLAAGVADDESEPPPKLDTLFDFRCFVCVDAGRGRSGSPTLTLGLPKRSGISFGFVFIFYFLVLINFWSKFFLCLIKYLYCINIKLLINN